MNERKKSPSSRLSLVTRKRLDIGAADIGRAWFGGPARPTADRLAVRFSAGRRSLACLSARSALDLFLTAIEWPAGTEILCSGANIPDMASVIRAHGFQPVAVDFDLQRLGPTIEEWEGARTPTTKAVLFAHLFGAQVPLDGLADFCRRHGLILIEDCAQAYAGSGFVGHPKADLSLFSFGPIKSATALGGGVALVADPFVYERMAALQETWPEMPVAEFRRRVRKFALWTLLSRPLPLALVDRWARGRGGDLDTVLHGASRSFPGHDLMAQLRRRAPPPLLHLLATRIARDEDALYASRAQVGDELRRRISDVVDVPYPEGGRHTYWVFPVLAAVPRELIAAVHDAGFDATQRATLAPLSPDLPRLGESFSRCVYLPIDPAFSARRVDRLSDAVRRGVESAGRTS